MPHFGRKVVGDASFDAQFAHEQATGNNHFGSRVSGPPVDAVKAPAGLNARDTIAAIPKGDIVALAEAELARPDGARKMVARKLLEEGGRRGSDPALLKRLVDACGEGE